MPATLTSLQSDTSDRLDDPNNRIYSLASLVTYINEGARDIARRAQVLQGYTEDIAIVAGTTLYALPSNFLSMDRLEFVPSGATQVYPVALTTKQELDQIWGINPSSQMSYPSFAYFVGTTGTGGTVAGGGPDLIQIGLYPVPAQSGALKVYYWRLPTPVASANDLVDVPEGWHDLLVLYAEYRARRKGRDPLWKDVKDEYEEKLAQMVDVTREWHDQAKFMMSQSGSAVPSWLYGSDW